ncbi:zinc finger, CCHC-type containing protein [Tanacetum coccineum]
MPELMEDNKVEAIRRRAKSYGASLESKVQWAEDASSKKFLCGKTDHFKRDCRSGKKNIANASGLRKGSKDQSQDQDSGATTHVCKDRCWFKTYEPVEDESVLYMGDDQFALVYGKGSVALEFSSVKTITLFNVLYVTKLRKNLVSGPMLNKYGYKQVYESDKYILSKSGVFVGFGYYNNGMFMLNLNKVSDDSDSVYMSSSTVVNSLLWHARLGHVHYKRMLEMSKDDLIPAIGIIHETTAPYTPQQNGMVERKNRALKEMVNSLLSYSGLSEGFWGEAMLTACYLLNRVPNKRNKTTPYEIWYKKRPNLSYLRVWGCRAVVRLLDPKRKILGEKVIDCIFVGYAEHSKAYSFYVMEPNDSVSINSIIESRDLIFDENHFSSIPRPKDIIQNLDESQRDDHSNDVPSETPEPRREAIDDEIGSIMENNTWVLSDLPLACKLLGCKWIFKRKMKVDGTIEKFKAQLVIQGFRQKEWIDYFDTYAPVVRITTIRLLLALAGVHNLVIHQMDIKTTFLNGDLDKEVYMKQPEGFVIPVDKTKKFLSSRFSMKDMGEADVILGIKIKRENKRIVITRSHYVEKILKKFNHEDYSLVSTLMDPVEKLKPNTGKPVDQLEYSRAIGCLMYVMTSTRPDIAYAVGRLSRFTSNPSRQHWQAITRVFKYLKGTMNYGLSYVGYPSVLEAYSDASWINHVEDSSSTSG